MRALGRDRKQMDRQSKMMGAPWIHGVRLRRLGIDTEFGPLAPDLARFSQLDRAYVVCMQRGRDGRWKESRVVVGSQSSLSLYLQLRWGT